MRVGKFNGDGQPRADDPAFQPKLVADATLDARRAPDCARSQYGLLSSSVLLCGCGAGEQ